MIVALLFGVACVAVVIGFAIGRRAEQLNDERWPEWWQPFDAPPSNVRLHRRRPK